MGMIKLLSRSLVILIFCLISAYVFLFGKKKTGINVDYVITSSILAILLWRMST